MMFLHFLCLQVLIWIKKSILKIHPKPMGLFFLQGFLQIVPNYERELFVSLGKTNEGLKDLASSNSIVA